MSPGKADQSRLGCGWLIKTVGVVVCSPYGRCPMHTYQNIISGPQISHPAGLQTTAGKNNQKEGLLLGVGVVCKLQHFDVCIRYISQTYTTTTDTVTLKYWSGI